MIGVRAVSAAFSHPLEAFEGLPSVQVTGMLKEKRTVAPCAAYAEKAVAALQLEPEGMALACVSGPTGITASHFDKAWRQSEHGQLTGEGFGRSRSKHIHPFTLVRSLQNQVPAVLSMTFGFTGPCLNALASATAPALLMPCIDRLLDRCPAVLLVMASAGGREENRARLAHLVPEPLHLEGAVCLVFTRQPQLGYFEAVAVTEPDEGPASFPQAPPVLRLGLALLESLALRETQRLIVLNDFAGYRKALHWRT